MKHAPLLSLAIVLLLGCGGRQLEILDDDASSPAVTGPGAGGGVTSPGAGGQPVGGPGGGGSGGTGGSGGSGSGGGGTTVDAGVGPGGPSAGIACGATICLQATQDCCVAPGPGGAAATCSPKGQCQGIALTCTSAASCGSGLVCCAMVGGGGGGAKCQPSCGGGGGGNFQLCSDDKECRMGQTCQPTPLGFKACRRGRRGGPGVDAG